MASDGYSKPEPRPWSAPDRGSRGPGSRRTAPPGFPRRGGAGRDAPRIVPAPDLTRLHFAPEGATRRPSEEHLTTLEFLGQGAAQRSGGRYEPLPRWGNPRRAVVAGLLAAALLGAVVHGGLVSTARGADQPVSDQAPSEVLRGASGDSPAGGDASAPAGRDTEAFGPPREACLDLPEREDEPRGSRSDGSGRTDLHRDGAHLDHPSPVRGDLFVGGDYLVVDHSGAAASAR